MSMAQAVQLRTALESELSWRRDEIREVRNWHSFGTGDGSSQSLKRVLIVMLYAHLEGFVRAALGEYVKVINDCDLTVAEAKEVLSAACLAEHLKKYRTSEPSDPYDPHAKQARQVEKDAQLIDKVISLAGSRVRLELDSVVSADSNLSPTVLRRNLAMLAVDHEEFDQFMRSMTGLLKRRNAIAHGDRGKPPSDKAMADLEENVFGICDNLMKVLYESTRDQVYRR